MQEAQRPASATRFVVGLSGLGGGLLALWLLAPWRGANFPGFIRYAPIVPCAGVFAVIAIMERLWPNVRGASLPGAVLRPLDLARVAVKLWGLIVTLAMVALAYWLLPEYRGTFYQPYWDFLLTLAPLLLLCPLYFAWMDRRIAEPGDDYYHLGRVALGRERPDGARLTRHLLGFAVKGFFLPLMTVYLHDEIAALYRIYQAAPAPIWKSFNFFYHLSYTVDLLFCVVGYTISLRLFDSHIRSVEPTLAGWLAALICYQPFYSVIGRYYLQYDDGTSWSQWLAPWPTIRSAWGGAINVLAILYCLSTVAFGLRFSNLTHRGIITDGPYRFSKHPAYIAKNLSWWLIAVPFVGNQDAAASLRNCCLLGLLNLVYYARAKTEERHLSQDANYVAYALWMNDHGLFRRIGINLRFLRYRAPVVSGDASLSAGRNGAAVPSRRN